MCIENNTYFTGATHYSTNNTSVFLRAQEPLSNQQHHRVFSDARDLFSECSDSYSCENRTPYDDDIFPGMLKSLCDAVDFGRSRDVDSPGGFCKMEKYTIQGELGQGTFGKVYKAEREEDNSAHALKCLTVDSIDKGQVVLKEIHALQKEVGEHPNIMQFTEVFTEGAGLNTPAVNVWMVLDYCSTLDRNPDRATVLQLLCEAAEGVAYLHGRNVVHGALKPDNILVDNSGQRPVAKIADFGIARVCERSGWDINSYYMQTAVGTRMYLAPEISVPLLTQRPNLVTYTAKTDVFALGLILAAILDRTTVPFNPGKVTPFLPDPANNGQPAPVADVMITHPGYPLADMLMTSEAQGSPLKDLVLSMLVVNPHQRPTSEQVLGSLKRITGASDGPRTNTQTQPSTLPPSPHTVVEMPTEDTDRDACSTCCQECWRWNNEGLWLSPCGKGPGWMFVLPVVWMEDLILFFPPPPVFMTRFWNNEAAGRCSFHSDAPTRQHNRLDVTENGRKNQPLFAYNMASLAKLFTRCLSLSSQVLPARGLHIPAEGPGWDFITKLPEPDVLICGRFDDRKDVFIPDPVDIYGNGCCSSPCGRVWGGWGDRFRHKTSRAAAAPPAHSPALAALDGAEDALNVHEEPTGSALRLLEAAEAFNVSQPANWCLKLHTDKRLTTSTPYNDGTTTSHTVQRRDNNISHRTTTGQQHLTPYNDGTTTSYTKSVVGGGTKPGGNPAFFRLLPPQSGIMTHQQPDSGHNSTSCHGRSFV
ncbi:hypothetical protein Bbelb_166170 [Branchiostoma belcheri]|nr:hypothetical protein Bbelb_166170 [Branchiostoma belcheri]